MLAYLERFRGAMELAAREERLAPDTLPRVAEVVLGQGTLADQSLSEARIRERLGSPSSRSRAAALTCS